MSDVTPIKGLCLDFPIRPNFLATLIVPRDITALEATRLCEFIKTLAITSSDGGQHE